MTRQGVGSKGGHYGLDEFYSFTNFDFLEVLNVVCTSPNTGGGTHRNRTLRTFIQGTSLVLSPGTSWVQVVPAEEKRSGAPFKSISQFGTFGLRFAVPGALPLEQKLETERGFEEARPRTVCWGDGPS